MVNKPVEHLQVTSNDLEYSSIGSNGQVPVVIASCVINDNMTQVFTGTRNAEIH